MPIYEFKCESCSHIDEHLMKINDPAPEKCSVCGGPVHKIMSMSSFSLKGTGWYATDYKSNPSKAPPEGTDDTTASTKPQATSETKTTESKAESSLNSEKK